VVAVAVARHGYGGGPAREEPRAGEVVPVGPRRARRGTIGALAPVGR
jgi:hypothetical protein